MVTATSLVSSQWSSKLFKVNSIIGLNTHLNYLLIVSFFFCQFTLTMNIKCTIKFDDWLASRGKALAGWYMTVYYQTAKVFIQTRIQI